MNSADFKENWGSEPEALHDDHSMDVHRLRQLVIKDDLTELYNRRYFKERLREEKRRCDLQGSLFSLMILDVDHFKEVNDNFGHVVGDKVLVQVARIIGESVREFDITCRYAGDEFVVILPGAGEEETESVIQRIVNNLNSFLWGERAGIELPGLTCSVGFSCYPDDARELSQLIKRADRALYRAKHQGRNCWIRWSRRDDRSVGDTDRSPKSRMLDMIGRVRERERLLQIIERVKGGAGATVLIEGEMGVGKTRLAQYAQMRFDHYGFRSLMINCFKETSRIPYVPLRECLSHLENSFEEELDTIRKEIDPGHLSELSKFYPSIAGKERVPKQERESQVASDEYRLFEAFLQLFIHISRVKPLAIVLENLQWADFATRMLMNYIARSIANEQILILALRRTGGVSASDGPDGVEDLERDGNLERIKLGNLSRDEVYLLIENLMDKEDLPERFLAGMYDRTAGNPLFVEEMIKYFSRQGKDSVDKFFDKEELAIPGSVMEMLKRQVEEIHSDRRAILAMASVIGVEFSFDLLMLLSLKNEGYLLDVFDEADRQGIVKKIEHPNEQRYAFVNPLFQQVLYEGVNKRRRRNLHKQIGRFLEKYYFDRIEELYGELAFHYQNGGDLRKALEYTVKAGDRAAELFANREAIHYYDRAIQQISSARENEADQRLYLYLMEKKADILDLIGEYQGAVAVYREIIGNLRELDRPGEDIARVLGKQGVVHDKVGETDLAIERMEEGMKLLGQGNPEERARLLSSMADIYLRDGRLNDSIDYCKEGLLGLKEDEETVVGAQINMTAGCTYLEMGEIRKAKRHMVRGIEIFESLGRIKELGRAYLSLGMLHGSKGNYDKGEEFYAKSLDIAKNTGNVSLLLACHRNLGMTARGKGNLKQAVKHWENGLALAEKIEYHRSVAELKFNLGTANRELGHTSLALNHLEASLRLFERLKSRLDILRVNRGLAILYMTIGHHQKAEKIMRINRVVADREESVVERALNLDVLARIYKGKGCFKKSEPLFEEAREGFRQGRDPEDLAAGLLHSVEMYIDWGKADAALPLLDEAREVVDKIGSKKANGIFCHLQGRLIHLQEGDLERAASLLKKAVRSFQSLDLPHRQLSAHHALGLVFQALGKSRMARQEFLHAAEDVDFLQKKIRQPDLLRKFREQSLVKDVLSKASNQHFS